MHKARKDRDTMVSYYWSYPDTPEWKQGRRRGEAEQAKNSHRIHSTGISLNKMEKAKNSIELYSKVLAHVKNR